MIYKLGFDQHCNTFTLILLAKIDMCSKLPWTKFMHYERFKMKFRDVLGVDGLIFGNFWKRKAWAFPKTLKVGCWIPPLGAVRGWHPHFGGVLLQSRFLKPCIISFFYQPCSISGHLLAAPISYQLFYPTQTINSMVLESQLSYKIVNSLCTITY